MDIYLRHNSVFYDEGTDKYFIFSIHAFASGGEHHEVRVHQMFINQDEWPVVAPYRYAGETISKLKRKKFAASTKSFAMAMILRKK